MKPKGYPMFMKYPDLIDGKEQLEIRNICWNCDNYFDVQNPEMYSDRDTQIEGGKMYLKCNHCGKEGNHL